MYMYTCIYIYIYIYIHVNNTNDNNNNHLASCRPTGRICASRPRQSGEPSGPRPLIQRILGDGFSFSFFQFLKKTLFLFNCSECC